MDEQMIVNQAVDRYNRLVDILRSETLKDEDAAFLRGQMLELMLLVYALDKQAIARLTECPGDTKTQDVSATRLITVNLN